MTENLISEMRADLHVFRAVVEANVAPTDIVLNGVWRWYLDVELHLPLPVMDMNPDERRRYAVDIINEMDAAFAAVEPQFDTMTHEDIHNLFRGEFADQVNGLWRELAGAYAYLINQSVVILDEEDKRNAEEHAVELISQSSGLDEDEIRDRIRHDSQMRLMLRRSGLDPDRIK